MVLGIVGEKLKLLLYSTKKIMKGSELLYDYGDGFSFDFKAKLRENIQICNIDPCK
jgi:hypothetical protein